MQIYTLMSAFSEKLRFELRSGNSQYLAHREDSNELVKRPVDNVSRPSAAGMPQRSLHGGIHGVSAVLSTGPFAAVFVFESESKDPSSYGV